jgi:hypothetical protein
MNWEEKSQIFNRLNDIVPKVVFSDNNLSDVSSVPSKAGSKAVNLSADEIVAILVNKVLDGDTEEMTREKSKVIRGKAKAMIVKIKRGTVKRPPMPEIPVAGADSSDGGIESLSKEDQVALLVNKGLDGDMDSVNSFQDKVLRGKAKAMIVKIKRGTVERPPLPEIPVAPSSNNSAGVSESEEVKILRLVTEGVKGNMDEINNLKDRVLRGKIKAAIVKEKRKAK